MKDMVVCSLAKSTEWTPAHVGHALYKKKCGFMTEKGSDDAPSSSPGARGDPALYNIFNLLWYFPETYRLSFVDQ